MIGNDVNAVADLVTKFRQVAGLEELSAEKREEFDDLSASALLPRFPGALLVWPRPNKCSVYYALAASSSEWRRLRPMLIAFAGPTLTNFNGWSDPLLPHIPVEAFLIARGFHVVARLVPGDEVLVREMTKRSLLRMIRAIAEAPTISHAAPLPTSRLLSQFIDCLNGNDRNGAESILEICRNELRVDALNLSFLRIRLLSHFSDWSGILELSEFLPLCHTRKPQAVTVMLLEALYQIHLAPIPASEYIEQVCSIWRNEVRFLARPLIRLPIPKSCSVGALKLYAWEALEAESRNPELEAAILEYRDEIGELAEALELAKRTGNSKNNLSTFVTEEPVAVAQQALMEAEDANTLSAISAAVSQFEQLNEEQLKELLRSEQFRSVWQSIYNETGGSAPPSGWIDWINRLSDPEFTTSFEVLQRAVSEWPATMLVDSVEITQFASALSNIPDIAPAKDRIADALPSLSAWVAEDPGFPRAGMIPVYEMLLYYLVIGSRRASVVYDSASLLIRALLSMGVTKSQYSNLLDDCLDLAGIGAGTKSVYWLLDIIEESILNHSPDEARRQAFWYAAHSRLVPLRAHFSIGQRIAVDKIGTNLGWEPPKAEDVSIPDNVEQMDHFRSVLSNKSIAIYSLTESAARQAEVALLAIAPDVKISLSHDTGGTPVLKSMAQNSDIFVVVTASAKHAATGFIQQMRPRDKPLLFAAGRGFSSIVRTIEEFVLRERV